MSSLLAFEESLPGILDSLGSGNPDYEYQILNRTVTLGQRPAWRHITRWLPLDLWTDRPPIIAPPWRLIGAVALFVVSLVSGLLFVGSQPSLLINGTNTLIAYSHGGDIYVGDPNTEWTSALTSGSDFDSGPVFSPDGTKIGFTRARLARGASSDYPVIEQLVVVVRRDGSDEQVVWTAAPEQPSIGFFWSPNSAQLALLHQPERGSFWNGELSLVDAYGDAEPRLITPPLPSSYGAGRSRSGVAGMFRPPDGGQILALPRAMEGTWISSEPGAIYLWDANMANHVVIRPDLPAQLRPGAWGEPFWSADGSLIMFEIWGIYDLGTETTWGTTVVMNPDGTGVREVGSRRGFEATWSPVDRMIAFRMESGLIFTADAYSGAEQELAASEGHGENGWAWTGDGRGIVMLDKPGEQPLVVDAQTGETSLLPWQVDSLPSWGIVRP